VPCRAVRRVCLSVLFAAQGVALQALKRTDEALAEFEQVIRMCGSFHDRLSADATWNSGVILESRMDSRAVDSDQRKRDAERAIDFFDHAQALYSEAPDIAKCAEKIQSIATRAGVSYVASARRPKSAGAAADGKGGDKPEVEMAWNECQRLSQESDDRNSARMEEVCTRLIKADPHGRYAWTVLLGVCCRERVRLPVRC
jgi:hypothetical protein